MSLPPPPTTAPSSSSNNNNHHPPPPPAGGPGTPPMARARLASILTETTAELDGLRSAYHDAQRRAKHFEDLANSLKVVSGNASEDQIRQHIQQLEQRTRDAEIARDTETARRVAITEMWTQLRDYLETVETHSRDARMGFDRIMQTGGGALQVLPPPKLNDHPPHRPYMPHPGYHGRVRHREDTGEGPPNKKSRISSQVWTPLLSIERVSRPNTYQSQPSYPGPPPQGYPPPSRPHRQRSPSRTPSDGSLDVDEMLLRTAENDGRQQQQQQQQQQQHPPVHRGQPYPSHDNPYPPPPHHQHLQPAMTTYQTHVFAPVVTGAPTKKGSSSSKSFIEKPPNHSFAVNPQPSSSKSLNNGVGPPTYPFTPPAIPIPSHNEEGQRLCRQCGQAGRYKDGKCVEKWGPGPLGPGTVCDRCRKKMKRVERRGTLDGSSQGQVHSGSFREEMPQNQPPPPPQSLGRTDTVLSQSGFESPAMRPMEPPPPPRQSSSLSPQITKRPSPQTRTPPMSSPRTHPPAPTPARVPDYPRATSPAATSKSDLDADADADEDELAGDTQDTLVAAQTQSQRWSDEERPNKVSPVAEAQLEPRKNGHDLPNGKTKTQPAGDVEMDILAAVDAAEEA